MTKNQVAKQIFGVPSLETAERIDDSDKVAAFEAATKRLVYGIRNRSLEGIKPPPYTPCEQLDKTKPLPTGQSLVRRGTRQQPNRSLGLWAREPEHPGPEPRPEDAVCPRHPYVRVKKLGLGKALFKATDRKDDETTGLSFIDHGTCARDARPRSARPRVALPDAWHQNPKD
jgi:hypothetical protein